MNILRKIFSPGCLTISLFLLFYTFYKSEIYWNGTKSNYYFIYYVVLIVLVIFSIITFYLNNKIKDYLIISLLSIITGLYASEGYLTFKKELAKAKKEATEKRIKEIKVKEDVDALISGENELSDEFKDKASTIFEAAVKSKVRTEIERLEDEYSKELTEQSDKAKDELVEKVDSYLDYVVQEWMKENELAIERGLKGEISEDFIAGLKQLFEDHYIDVPDEKYDVLEAQSKKIEELEEQLNLQIEKDKELHSEIGELTKDSIIKDVSDDLVDTEVEKFKGLVEDVDYSDAESYKTKLETLKESYFPKRAEEQSTNEISDDEAVKEVETSGKMAEYMSAISKTHERAK